MDYMGGDESAEDVLNRLLQDTQNEEAPAMAPSTNDQPQTAQLSNKVTPEALRHEDHYQRGPGFSGAVEESAAPKPQHFDGEMQYNNMHNIHGNNHNTMQQPHLESTTMNGQSAAFSGHTMDDAHHSTGNQQQYAPFHHQQSNFQPHQPNAQLATEAQSTGTMMSQPPVVQEQHQHQQPLDFEPFPMDDQAPLQQAQQPHQQQQPQHSTQHMSEQNFSNHHDPGHFATTSLPAQNIGPQVEHGNYPNNGSLMETNRNGFENKEMTSTSGHVDPLSISQAETTSYPSSPLNQQHGSSTNGLASSEGSIPPPHPGFARSNTGDAGPSAGVNAESNAVVPANSGAIATNSTTNTPMQQPRSAPPPAPGPSANDAGGVIDLLDSDDEEQGGSREKEEHDRKRQRVDNAITAMQGRAKDMPQWTQQQKKPNLQPPRMRVVPGAAIGSSSVGASLHSIETASALEKMYQPSAQQPTAGMHPNAGNNADGTQPSRNYDRIPDLYKPQYIRIPESFTATWSNLMPHPEALQRAKMEQQNLDKRYSLSLLNCREFTIEGLSARYDLPATPVASLRLPIKKISRDYGGATFERDKQNGGMGKWRIPLAAYQNFVSYLRSDPKTRVEGIPPHQLQMASLERARQEKGYPSAEAINDIGVPTGLAQALAPFQRGGVDFVVEKKGRALIADDMGLGKTIQGIASMSVYMDEWPVLVLSPSSARYHWESEFQRFLGLESKVNLDANTPRDRLLHNSQIHVLTSSRSDVLPRCNTRVVICSYGLAPALVESGRMKPGQFKCAIVDESHMLKNKSTKRTASLAPILSGTERCVLLSGTPALARPAELWPQLQILDKRNTWWQDENEFLDKYVKRATPRSRAELHAMLTGTFMIRRLKKDILKTMEPKKRFKTDMSVVTADNREEFKELLLQMRQGKGELAKIAHEHKISHIRDDIENQVKEGIDNIRAQVQDASGQLSGERLQSMSEELRNKLKEQTAEQYSSRVAEAEEDGKNTRRRVLSRLYSLTGNAKIPFVAEMLHMWLNDPTKGKLCIFAHHINVLNALRDLCSLSNDASSQRKYIRIDGSTTPKVRQQQINAFQNDPTIRVALLGITAAGVAVTLTAAATVWFAELFWTPAIMIQAEDRCHRIGQQAQVKCTYFVGKGTLDELLWKLIEKKFRQLGEFVEGKDKEKLVVDKVFKNINEYKAMFESKDDLEEEEEGADEEEEDLAFDPMSLESDIGAFANEEMEELKQVDSDDEEGNEASSLLVAKQGPTPPVNPKKEGASEAAAITLSDDEDEEEGARPSKKESEFNIFKSPLDDCRIYSVSFPGGRLGIELTMIKGRIVVVGLSEGRIKNFGAKSKPAIGDVLVGIKNHSFPLYNTQQTSDRAIKNYLRTSLSGANHALPLLFAESRAIQIHIEKAGFVRDATQPLPKAPPARSTSSGANEVIEID